jgi:hypothetical protein
MTGTLTFQTEIEMTRLSAAGADRLHGMVSVATFWPRDDLERRKA